MRLSGQAIKTTLPGSVLKLDTPLGTVVPISFGGNGIMSGDAGRLASYLGSQRDRGRYWLTEDRICYKWFRWFSGEQHCLSIARDGKKIFWKREDGETGTATLEEHHKAPSSQPTWNTISQQASKKRSQPEHAEHHRTVTTAAANDTQHTDEPVLIKLPTLAIRPHKRTTDVASEEASGSTTLVKSQPPPGSVH
jgi:hypothetical protein